MRIFLTMRFRHVGLLNNRGISRTGTGRRRDRPGQGRILRREIPDISFCLWRMVNLIFRIGRRRRAGDYRVALHRPLVVCVLVY